MRMSSESVLAAPGADGHAKRRGGGRNGPGAGRRGRLAGQGAPLGARRFGEIGRASCRERVCQSVSISVVAVSLKQQINIKELLTKYKRNNVTKYSRTQHH